MEKPKKLQNSFKKLKEHFSLLQDEPMKNHTSIKVGGPADLFAMPETKDEFINLIKTAYKENIPLCIIGNGTNLLVTDKGIRGLVISTSKLKIEIKTTQVDSETFLISVLSGTKLSALCNFCLKNSLKGLEFAAGIPGSIGGAVTMNAGTPAGSISEVVDSLEIITNQGETRQLKKDDLNFSYRRLNPVKGIITEASFLFKVGDSAQIKLKHDQNLKNKKATQPIPSKSAGCIFKNPENCEPAGKLIDMAGLKGKKIGEAVISDKHANFILNLGNAKCNDILKLKELVKNKISDLYSVELETEIIIKGE